MSFDSNYKGHNFELLNYTNNYKCTRCLSTMYFYSYNPLPEYYFYDNYKQISEIYNKLTCDEVIVKKIIE